jgi:hypothetical protein
MRISSRKVIYASTLLCLLAATAGVLAYTTTSGRPQEPHKVHLPKRFLSEVKKLKVESHWIENEGTPDANLVVVIRNKSALAVTHVSVTIADLTVSRDGGAESDEPQTVIEPYATAQFSIPVTNFIDNSPFVISAAIYADGTDEGREQQLRWAHKDREAGRAKRAAKKGGPER